MEKYISSHKVHKVHKVGVSIYVYDVLAKGGVTMVIGGIIRVYKGRRDRYFIQYSE